MLDMLKDKNLLIGAAIGVGASYAMKGSGKGTFPRAALYGVIGAAAGKMILPKVLGKSTEGNQAATMAKLQALAEKDSVSDRSESNRLIAESQQAAETPAAAEGMYVGRIRRHY